MPAKTPTGREGGRPAERPLLDLLGLAHRARRLVAGTDAVRKAAREGTLVGALLAADAAATQRAKLVPLLEARRIWYAVLLTREQMGDAIGRAPVAALGLTDASFARRARELAAAFPALQDRVQEEA